MKPTRSILIWLVLLAAIAVPLGLALQSPLLAWRQPIYIAAGIAGVLAMGLLLLQPLLASGRLPGLPGGAGRQVHRWIGAGLIFAVIVHVIALWITSPPDVVDALLYRSPTPFSAWGVTAMWAVFAAGFLALVRSRLRPRTWRTAHGALVSLAVITCVLHALLIEGTMEPVSKALLCALVVIATGWTVWQLRLFWPRTRR
ncbi:MAG: ferric reductase-like transmembrane domain-containing protein [Paracoccaceae bacterium]